MPSFLVRSLLLTSTLIWPALAFGEAPTATPIKHVIVVVGENHTFDNLFATYKPARGESVFNLLSEGIINEDGAPGPNFAKAAQNQADAGAVYSPTPKITAPYATLPQPQTTYATGLPQGQPDARFPAQMPNGPFQFTKHVSYADYTGDPVHRFFQMWQQFDGGKLDLFPWVAETAGIGPQNGAVSPQPGHTFQGGEAMGFYNMARGDAPGFKALAEEYALADNYHQSIMGGTGANFFALVTGDVAVYGGFAKDGKTAVPPADRIENPDPQPGTNNFYKTDGYKGGSYVNCSDVKAPGVGPIRAYMDSLPYQVWNGGNCAAGAYYLVNNYDPQYDRDGKLQVTAPDKFYLPPQTMPNIGEALSAKGVSWKYYIGGRKDYKSDEYCSICDPLTDFTGVMQGPLKQNLVSLDELDKDMETPDKLPAVIFVRPSESDAGHPANARLSDFEEYVLKLVRNVQAHKKVWKNTAILVTVDEGGGHYDSGYIQTVDFFGDGTRIPLINISPYARKGHVDHTYYDHASVLKFIEANWRLKPLSARSRDNLPNPVVNPDNPYVPVNRAAIGDLMNMFDFSKPADLTPLKVVK